MKYLNKTALLLAVCWSALLASGCAGYDVNACYESVRAAYPDAEVQTIPGEKWRFLVRTKEGDIIYVETMNATDPELTQKFIAFRGS